MGMRLSATELESTCFFCCLTLAVPEHINTRVINGTMLFEGEEIESSIFNMRLYILHDTLINIAINMVQDKCNEVAKF